MVRTQHLPLPAKTARELGIARYRGPSCVVSSCVIFGQETPLCGGGYGHIADGIRAEGAVHRTACFRSVGLVSVLGGAEAVEVFARELLGPGPVGVHVGRGSTPYPVYRFNLIAWCLTWGLCDQLRRLVVLVDHATEDLAPSDRQVQRRAGLAVLVGRSLLAGLVRAVAVEMAGVLADD